MKDQGENKSMAEMIKEDQSQPVRAVANYIAKAFEELYGTDLIQLSEIDQALLYQDFLSKVFSGVMVQINGCELNIDELLT